MDIPESQVHDLVVEIMEQSRYDDSLDHFHGRFAALASDSSGPKAGERPALTKQENGDGNDKGVDVTRPNRLVEVIFSPVEGVMGDLETTARSAKARLLPMADQKANHEKESSLRQAYETPPTTGIRDA